MKYLKFLPIFFFLFSCKGKYLIAERLELDSKKDIYFSKEMLKQPLGDFEMEATITFHKSYRRNKTGWVGLMMETDKIDGLHGTDSGYTFYIQENGQIGIDSSPPTNKELRKSKFLKRFDHGVSMNLKIINSNSSITIFVDGQQQFYLKNLKLNGRYMSANIGGASATIDIKSLKAI